MLDLGEWWLLETGLPLPLGVNVARRDVERLGDLSAVLREAIACGLDHREEALDYALQFGRGIDAAVADRFVSMYVNELTQDYGDEGRSAVTELLRRGEAMRAFPAPVSVDWIGGASRCAGCAARARRDGEAFIAASSDVLRGCRAPGLPTARRGGAASGDGARTGRGASGRDRRAARRGSVGRDGESRRDRRGTARARRRRRSQPILARS